jgi:hypothetical protein
MDGHLPEGGIPSLRYEPFHRVFDSSYFRVQGGLLAAEVAGPLGYGWVGAFVVSGDYPA